VRFVNLLRKGRDTVDELKNHIPICNTVDQFVAKCHASVCQTKREWRSNTIDMIEIKCWCVDILQGVRSLEIIALMT